MVNFNTIRNVSPPKAEDFILTRRGLLASAQRVKNLLSPLTKALGMSSLEDYKEGLLMTSTSQGILYNGVLYVPFLSMLPFTTTSVFDTEKWDEVKVNSAIDTSVTLVGNTTIPIGRESSWEITDYNAFSEYSVSVPEGFIGTIQGAIVTVYVPEGYGDELFGLQVTRDGSSSIFTVNTVPPTIYIPTV